ncbi:unnamed protein product, partial [Pocillopora meandrina]
MVLVGFYLPPESGERMQLGITVLLAMIVFLQLVYQNLPSTSNSAPLLGKFYIVTMFLIALSLAATCLVLNYSYGRHCDGEMPIFLNLCLVLELTEQKMSRFLVLLPSLFPLFMVSVVLNVNNPISPKEYQAKIRGGFSTNWFKSKPPLKKYSEQNIIDVHEKGFSNLRLRCRADLYSYDFSTVEFKRFLGSLTTVVDDCLKHDLIPIISWIHHHAEAYATEKDRVAYVGWWTAVARQLKDRDYRLSFNLFTELGIDTCKEEGKSCDKSLRRRTDKYNEWTKDVTKAIRGTGGNNTKRILILGSPGKTAKDLPKIDSEIYKNDRYMMVEWHLYASGPNKEKDSQKYWSGDGKSGGQANVEEAISYATSFSNKTGLLTYLGAWMPHDNANGGITETEAIKFARFFVKELRKENIPWSLNVLDN